MRTCSRHGVIYHYRFNTGGRARWRCRRCVGEAVTRRKQRVRKILKKCVLLCANCHGEVEAGLIESPPAQARYEGGAPPKGGRAPPPLRHT